MLTGYGRGDLEDIGPHQEIQPAKVAEDMLEAVKLDTGKVVLIHEERKGEAVD